MNDSKSTQPHSERAGFCEHLRQRREERSLSLEEIARTTKIPARSLVCLEQGEFEKLPADVFVRGFLRSYADCVGLDAEETVRRYAACGLTPGPVATPEAGALVDPNVTPSLQAPAATTDAPASTDASEVRAEPEAGDPESEPEPVAARPKADPPRREARKRRRKKRRRARADKKAQSATEAQGDQTDAAESDSASAQAPALPVLVIDDDDPGAAEALQSRRAKGEERERDFSRRMFLPPVLLDPDQGSRRGALTLGVIILVIVATITMSYLLRRPSSSTDGVTELRPAPSITAASDVELLEA